MRFTDFLRTTVLLSAGSATVLAAVAVAGAANNGSDLALAMLDPRIRLQAGRSR